MDRKYLFSMLIEGLLKLIDLHKLYFDKVS